VSVAPLGSRIPIVTVPSTLAHIKSTSPATFGVIHVMLALAVQLVRVVSAGTPKVRNRKKWRNKSDCACFQRDGAGVFGGKDAARW
jgi:hypothetical protein